MIINKDLEIALNAVSFLRMHSGKHSTEKLAQITNSTIPFLQQIMRKLKLAKVVVVQRGPGGGYGYHSSQTAFTIARALGHSFIQPSELIKPGDKLKSVIEQAFRNIII